MITLRLIVFAMVTFGTMARGEPADTFAIYLTAEPVDRRITAYGKGDWSHLRLAESPVIAAADVISYDFTSHTLRLRAEALGKIPRPPVQGTPFVVVAEGRRVYLGVFTTSLSSLSFAVPSIRVDRPVTVADPPADTVVIERAYPTPAFGAGPDPRGDERIKAALRALHQSKGKESGGSQAPAPPPAP